jgi:serine/threonine-protein kinase
VVGKTRDEAVAEIQAAGFVPSVEEVASNDAEENTVVSTEPTPGSSANAGDTIIIRVATGPETVPVPDVAGQDEATATNTLVDAGFQPSRSAEESDSVAAGSVIRTEPAANTQVAPGSNVTIVVSSGQGQVGVPNVEGLSLDAAQAQLSGFDVQVTDQRTTDAEQDGIVASQNPPAGSEAAPGSTISLVVYRYTEPEDPPDTDPTFTLPTFPGGGGGGGGGGGND